MPSSCPRGHIYNFVGQRWNKETMQNQRDILYELLELLPQDGAPIRAKDLEKKSKMSTRSFYKALSYLETIDAIEKKKVPSTRATGIEYNISPDFRTIDLDKIICIAGGLISRLFISYDNVEENQKEETFDNRLSAIIRFLKLCKTLREKEFGKN
jgi:hypothetical protein